MPSSIAWIPAETETFIQEQSLYLCFLQSLCEGNYYGYYDQGYELVKCYVFETKAATVSFAAMIGASIVAGVTMVPLGSM